MDKFIEKLNDIANCPNALYSAFAIDNKRKTGMKIALSAEQIRNFLYDAIGYLCKNEFTKKQLGEYPSATPKEYIETIKSNDIRISEHLTALLNIPFNVETNVTNLLKYDTYMLRMEYNQSQYLFFTNKKPFIGYKKNNFIFAKLGLKKDYDVVADDVIRLIKHFDCIIVENICYMVTSNGRKLLGLQKMEIEQSLYNQQLLLEKGIISPNGRYVVEKYMCQSGKQKCLFEIDNGIMEELSNINETNVEEITQKYQLKIISGGSGKFYVSVADNKEVEKLVNTLTNKRGKNFNGDIVSAKSPFTLEHQQA